MQNFFLVFLGAGLGGAARHAVNLFATHVFGSGFPIGTLSVNIVGSVVMGVLTGWFALKGVPGDGLRLFLTSGFLGGFTTFSAFSLDAVALYQQGQAASAAIYIAASVGLALTGLVVGLLAARLLV